MRLKIFSSLFLVCVFVSIANAGPIFVNGLTIPGNTGDQFGTSVNDGRLGFFSDLYYDPNRNEWWALSDRGPGGGTLSYDTRVQRFTLDIDPNTGAISNFQVVETIKFTRNGEAFNGLAPNQNNVLGMAFDPEGFVVHPLTGHFLVSDEYGPSLYEFERSGEFLRAFTNPANVIPRNAANVPNYASNTGNTAGRSSNRGYEGLAISPDGRYAYAMLQSQMRDELSAPYTRIVKFDTASGSAIAQYAYKFDISGNSQGISALVAVNDHQFLVLERNNRGLGVDSNYNNPDKRVYFIDLDGATDVSALDLDAPGASFTPVSKALSPWIDLDAVTLAELGNRSPEKWEGLAIGPMLADGTYLILAGTDNDYSVTQNDSGTQFDVWFDFITGDRVQCALGENCAPAGYSLLPGVLYAYKTTVGDPVMAGYRAPVPEPTSWSMLLAGLGLVGVIVRRRRI
ncbi:esterase-like activity of phytase family protein [Methylothermus subterraneus]